jgi:hypothetical protein
VAELLTPEYAAQEMLRRQRARVDLVAYSKVIDIPGVPNAAFDDPVEEIEIDGILTEGRLIDREEREIVTYEPLEVATAIHHELMMREIQTCIETPRGRSIIMAPPGSAKSTYASVVGTSWAMGRRRNCQVILGSYGTSIAAKQSRKVRSICRSAGYTAIWPRRPLLMDDQRAVDDWSLSNGSSFMAAGLLAGITGNRCDLLVLDDVVQNREQADSATIREKIWAEYTDTAMTRAKPWMSVILIMTRWHEDDLVGSILPESYEGESGPIHCRDGQIWRVLCIPAEAERHDDPLGRQIGEFLWPEWFPRAHWSTWRDDPRAARTWAALFQQRPAPFMGIHFTREHLQWYDPWLPRSDEAVELFT